MRWRSITRPFGRVSLRVTSPNGEITVPVAHMAALNENTVWTWNAIGKRKGAWTLAKNAPEATKGFLLNHLISDVTPQGDYANADPVTGQAAWFDLRVSIRKADAQADESQPQFKPLGFNQANTSPLRYGADLRKAGTR